MGAEHVARGLRRGDCALVDEQRLGVGGLDVHHRLEHRVDLPLDVVRLVDHEGDRRCGRCGRRVVLRERDLAHDPEELERVDRSDDQVVVGVLAAVEVEAAEQALGQQERDDLLDIRPRGWWPVSTSTCACGPSRLQISAAVPQSGRSVL